MKSTPTFSRMLLQYKRLAVVVLAGSILLPGITYSAAGAAGEKPNSALMDLPNIYTPESAGLKPPPPAAVSPINPLQLIPDIPQSGESIDKVTKLEAEGEKLFRDHLLDKALIKWQEAYGLSKEMKYAEGEGSALTNMCRIYLERGQWIKAKYLGENAIEVLSGLSDKRALGRARVALAQAYFGMDNTVWAGQQLDDALRIFTSEQNAQSAPEAAQILSLAGALLIKYGKLKEALQFFEAAATYFSQAGEQIKAIATYAGIASSMQSLGLFVGASEEADKAVAMARNTPEKPQLMVGALAIKANALYNLCEYASARDMYEQMIKMASKTDSKTLDMKGRAAIDLGYAFCLSATGDQEAAKQIFDRA
ncbi:MAG TPA: hypothetical protein V6C72_00775, partial [Chroococcales cyanobacterium]